MIVRITVNELCRILKKHFGKEVNLIGVEVANMINHHHPEYKEVDIGGVCNLHLDIKEMLKK